MVRRATKSVTITARITPDLNRKLEAYARLTQRTKSQALETVMDHHLAYEMWFHAEVQKGVQSLEDHGPIPHEEMVQRLRAHVSKRKRERRTAA